MYWCCVLQVYRKYEVISKKKLRRKEQAFEECELPPEYKRDLICEMAINIPKVSQWQPLLRREGRN